MSNIPVYARAVAEALEKHLLATVPNFYWATARGKQWPYAPSTRWPDQPMLDYHLRDTGDGLVVRVIHNTNAEPLMGEILLGVKFSAGLASGGDCIEAIAKFMNNLDVGKL